MLINILDAFDYLLLLLILLPGSNQRSLKADDLGRKNETVEEGAKSLPLLKENFVDGQCPPTSNGFNINGVGAECRYDCSSDVDCREDYKCCENGCSFLCVEPWFPNRVVDWTKTSASNRISGDPEQPDQRDGPWKSRGEPCSTSVLDGLQPLRCPSNYECRISTEEDIQLNIPNRGECIRIHDKKIENGGKEKTNHSYISTLETECSYNGEVYNQKEKFRKDCNICVCHNGVVFCSNRPCPLKIGIPAAVSSYKEQKQTSRDQIISIDSNSEVDEDDDVRGSGSFGSGDGGGTQGERLIELSSEADGEDSGYGDDTENVEEQTKTGDVKITSFEREETTRDDDESSGDGESREAADKYRKISNNNATGSGSGPAKIEQLEKTEPSRTTKSTEPDIPPSTITTTTIKTKITTQISTSDSPSASESSTLPPSVAQTKTSESRIIQTIKPTEDVIRLEGSGSGDDWREEGSSDDGSSYGSSNGSGDGSGSTHERSVRPDTIVLGYVREEGDEADTTGENLRSDVQVHDGAQSQRSENVGEEESGGSGKELRRSQTSEYFATTDDEH